MPPLSPPPHNPAQPVSDDTLLAGFLDHVAARGIELYPAQEEAILALFDGNHVVLNTPTGSGKSLVAAALHYHSLARGRRSVYTSPIKALVNEKFLDLCRLFGAANVGMSTGDASVNRGAPILCCTAEILSNIGLAEGPDAEVHDLVMDEFHYYSDRERGFAWQVPLLTLPQCRFLLMSATMGRIDFFLEELRRRTTRPATLVQSSVRPVPLEFSYVETPLEQTVTDLLQAGRAPVYVVHFTQRECAENAAAFASLAVATREEREALSRALDGVRFNSPFGQEIKRLLRQGIGLHHAGLLPKYRVLVETLAQKGLLKVVCGTDTLGVGVNVPLRTVLFTALSKFDGDKMKTLSVRDFQQICGRAGRKGYDDRGWVVCQAPPHVVENRQIDLKTAADPSKKKKLTKARPPEGFVGWDETTFRRLISSAPEPLVSSFKMNHGMLLQLLSRKSGTGCRATRDLIAECHETVASKAVLRDRTWQLFRALVERGIVELRKRGEPGPKFHLNIDLQRDFSLHETLSLYLVDTVPLLDREAPDYALRVLSLVESIVDDPELILRKQLDRVKTEKLAELKAAGVEYEQRMEELEKLEHPKPDREFIYETFNAFAAKHPWVGQENIRPKSVAREMLEGFLSFADYIKRYELQRSEGLLLRHLNSVHKGLTQILPDQANTEEVREIAAYLEETLRTTDSSLVEEWERLQNLDTGRPPEDKADASEDTDPARFRADITRDRAGFLRLARQELFLAIRSLSARDFAGLLEELPDKTSGAGTAWTEHQLRQRWEAYLEAGHERPLLDPEGRSQKHTHLDDKPASAPGCWLVEQVIVDPEAYNDWVLVAMVDLVRSRTEGYVWWSLVDLRAVALEPTRTEGA